MAEFSDRVLTDAILQMAVDAVVGAIEDLLEMDEYTEEERVAALLDTLGEHHLERLREWLEDQG